MYDWRKMNAAQREEALREREIRRMPFHGPPHYGSDVPCIYHLTASCYEHRKILGKAPARMAAFEKDLVAVLGGAEPGEPAKAGTTSRDVLVVPALAGRGAGEVQPGEPPEGGTTSGSANSLLLYWCVLPNHWHALVRTNELRALVRKVGQLHGRTSFFWNREDDARGRKCWHCCADRRMRNEAHVLATVNYILNNAVHHGYVSRWQDWPYSNARDYLHNVGAAEAARRWKDYPVNNYGKGWDDAGL